MAEVNQTNSDQYNKLESIETNDMFSKTRSYQYRGLLLKNFSIQSRLWCTNCCQIITPLICLTMVYIFKTIILNNLKGSKILHFVDVPLFTNNPFYDDIYEHEKNCLIWYLYEFEEGISEEDVDFIGQNSGVPNASTSGLFGNLSRIQQYCNTSQLNVPYFQISNESDPNLQIIDAFEEVNFTFSNPNPPGLDGVPDGVYYFYNASPEYVKALIEIDDIAINNLHRVNGISEIEYSIPNFGFSIDNFFSQNKKSSRILNNGSSNQTYTKLSVSQGYLIMIDTLTKGLLKQFTDVCIEFLVSYMPQEIDQTNILISMLNVLSSGLYPFALALGLPVFMYSIVYEKEERIIQMMKMNGMRIQFYWLSALTYNSIIYWITAILFWIYGLLILRLSFFTLSGFLPMFVLLFGWGFAQIGLSFFFASLISKTRTSSILGYLLSMFLMLIAAGYNESIYNYPSKMPFYYYIIPHFSFSRITYLFCIISGADVKVTMGSYTNEPELLCAILFLYGMGLLYMLLGVYLFEVVKSDFGVRRHPLFCLKRDKKMTVEERKSIAAKINLDRLTEIEGEDDDCANERINANEINSKNTDYPLVINSIRKVYFEEGTKEEKVAVRCFSLAIQPGETFGLLGPNGAGKTTLIAMLTGLYPPTEGNAWIAGYDIKSQISKVHLNIGVCPQFDLLWPDLTVEEHLLFYGRLKGCAGKNLDKLVLSALQEVQLNDKKKQMARNLSGGMKRRLSVAISLVGNPKIVFLDEPTTGLDPDNKRQLWDILTRARGKRAILITTHSMEEADVLCSRIGIIAFGMLRCVATQTRLKNLYGGGYRVYINLLKPQDIDNYNVHAKKLGHPLLEYKDSMTVQNEVIKVLNGSGVNCEILKNLGTVFSLKIIGDKILIGSLFGIFEKFKEDYLISDWLISQSSLDDVFLNIVEKAEETDLKKGLKINKKEDQ